MKMKKRSFKIDFVLILTLSFIFALTFLTRFGEVVNYTITYASSFFVFLIFIFFIVDSILKKRPIKVDIYLLIFIVAVGFSIIFSHYKYHAFSQFLNFLFPTLLSIIILNSIDQENFKVVLNFIVFTSFLFGFVSYLFYYSYAFGQFPSISLYGQKYAFVSFETLQSLWQYNNAFGAFLILSIFTSMGFVLLEKNDVKRAIYFIISVFLTFLIIITSSRGSYIAYILSMVVFVSILHKNFLKALLLEVLVLLFAIILIPSFASPFTVDVILNKNTQFVQFVQGEQNVSLYMRIYFVKLSFERFLQNPFKPIGIGSFKDFYSLTVNIPDKIRFDPHSLIARILVETGIYGIIPFLLYVFNAYKVAFKNLKNASFVYVGLFSGLTGFFIHMCMDVDSLLPITLVYLFLGFALLTFNNQKSFVLSKRVSLILILFLVLGSIYTFKTFIASVNVLIGDNLPIETRIEYYKNGIALDKNNSTYHYLLGQTFKDLGDASSALKEFEFASSLNPLDYRFPDGIGQIYLDTKNPLSIKFLTRAKDLRKTDFDLKGLVALAYILTKGDINSAKTLISFPIDDSFSNTNIAYGFILLKEGNLGEGKEYIVKGIKANNKNPYGQLGLAYYYAIQNNSKQVKARFEYLKNLDLILYNAYKNDFAKYLK